MRRETILENDFVTLWYYPSTKIVHHQIHQYIQGEPVRALLLAGLELFRKYGAYKWLSDDRKNAQLNPADVKWSEEHWMPHVIDAGWKYWAIVPPETMVGQMDMQRQGVERHIQDGIQVCIFEGPESALAWLESVR